MYPEKPDNTKQKVAAGVVTLVVVALLAIGAGVYNSKQSSGTSTATNPTTQSPSSATTATQTTTPSASTTPAASTTSSGYKNGTYTSTSTYYVPHGSESIKVTLTVSGGVVTDSQVENSEYDRESAEFQEAFASEYKSQVVGKKLSDVQLSYVAGASDTTQGFNDALSQIRTQAQS